MLRRNESICFQRFCEELTSLPKLITKLTKYILLALQTITVESGCILLV